MGCRQLPSSTARCGWRHGRLHSSWHPHGARPRPQMVGASVAPAENQPHVCTSAGALDGQQLCTGSRQGRAGKAAAAAPAVTTKAPEGLQAKPSCRGPTARQLSPFCNEAVCLSDIALAWDTTEPCQGCCTAAGAWSPTVPQHSPAAAGCSWFPGQGEQDGCPNMPPDSQPGAISAPLPQCGVCSLSGGSGKAC